MLGSSSDDYIDGGKGNDTIYGNNGDDIIIGGKGQDVIHAGPGDDVIVLSKKLGRGRKNWDLITDFVKGKDYLQIENKKRTNTALRTIKRMLTYIFGIKRFDCRFF